MLLNRRRLVIGASLLCLLLAGVLWGAFQPWTANHFGYALPGQDRLPYRISYAGRDYSNLHECAGADWCQPAGKRCFSEQQLIDEQFWPLAQVGSISTLFGAAHLVLAPPSGGHIVMELYVLEGADCYLAYTIEGGP